MARGLEAQGADFLVMPCNTAHYYLPAIARSVGIPLLDMVQLAIRKLGGRSAAVGLLASPAVRMVGLYKARMEQAGLQAIFPESQEEELLGVIKAVKAGKQGAEEKKDYAAVAQHLRQAGAEALLVACTELSVLTPPDTGCPVVDALDVLVEATIDGGAGVNALLVKPTGAGLGAEISDVDLRKLDDRLFAKLHRAWLQNLVLLVRDQQLTGCRSDQLQPPVWGSRLGACPGDRPPLRARSTRDICRVQCAGKWRTDRQPWPW